MEDLLLLFNPSGSETLTVETVIICLAFYLVLSFFGTIFETLVKGSR